MRLPPVPVDVVHVRVGIDVNSYPCSFGFWLLVPGASAAGQPYLRTLLGDWFFACSGSITECMHNGARLDVLQADAGGPSPSRAFITAADNHGRWTGGQANNLATGLYVTSGSGGRGSGSRIRIPAVPDIFVTNNQTLNRSGYGNLIFASSALQTWVAGIVPPGGGSALIGTLQRKRAGAPLAAAAFDPAAAVVASPVLEYLDKRLLARRHLSPTS